MSKYYQGLFKPKNPSKYIGNPKNINYRSSWEFKYMRLLDLDESIISWASEEFSIPYYSPIDKKIHRYFPDFFVKKTTTEGIKSFIIEIKPKHQTKKPINNTNKRKKTLLNEQITYVQNQMKWQAASEYCLKNGFIFQILTEKELGIK